jgi:hypothetical protein
VTSFCTVTDTYQDISGAPYTGYVQFSPSCELQDTVNGITLGTTGVQVQLDGSGHFSEPLRFTNDPSITPNNPSTNSWAYMVTEMVIAPGQSVAEARAPFFIQLPMSLGSSAVLAQLVHTGQQPGFGWFYGPW